jgi:hypothetical protein
MRIAVAVRGLPSCGIGPQLCSLWYQPSRGFTHLVDLIGVAVAVCVAAASKYPKGSCSTLTRCNEIEGKWYPYSWGKPTIDWSRGQVSKIMRRTCPSASDCWIGIQSSSDVVGAML